MSGVSFYLSLVFLLLFFGKLRFHLNAARQKSLSAFLPKKLADAFYDTFIRFRLSVDVAGFVSSASASAVDVVDGFCSVLGSACCFWFWLWVWFLECRLIPKAFFDLVRFEVDVRSLFAEFFAC